VDLMGDLLMLAGVAVGFTAARLLPKRPRLATAVLALIPLAVVAIWCHALYLLLS
jgi:hypothetical protein